MSLDNLEQLLQRLIDINGATRQMILAGIFSLVLLAAALWFKPLLRRMQLVTVLALVIIMAVLGYVAGNPCRPDYYMKCGVNTASHVGLTLGILLLVGCLYMAARRGSSWWLLLAGYISYYMDFLWGFHHPGILLRLAAMAVAGGVLWLIYRALRQRRQTASSYPVAH